MVVNPCLGD